MKVIAGVLVIAAFSLPASAQNAGPHTPTATGAQEAGSAKADLSRTQPLAPIAANAPRFVSSGLEIKIASFGTKKKPGSEQVGVTTSIILLNNNDYDVALLNVEGFNVIDNAGNSWRGQSSDQSNSNVNGVMACFVDVRRCTDKNYPNFVPYEAYTVVSAKTAIALTYFVRTEVEGDVGSLFTFSTKMMMYKVGSDNEIAQTEKVQKPRMITIGIPNILHPKT